MFDKIHSYGYTILKHCLNEVYVFVTVIYMYIHNMKAIAMSL